MSPFFLEHQRIVSHAKYFHWNFATSITINGGVKLSVYSHTASTVVRLGMHHHTVVDQRTSSYWTLFTE